MFLLFSFHLPLTLEAETDRNSSLVLQWRLVEVINSFFEILVRVTAEIIMQSIGELFARQYCESITVLIAALYLAGLSPAEMMSHSPN